MPGIKDASLQAISFKDLLRLRKEVAKASRSSRPHKQKQAANPENEDDQTVAIADDAVSLFFELLYNRN